MNQNSLKKFKHLFLITFAIFLDLLFTACPSYVMMNPSITDSPHYGRISGFIKNYSDSKTLSKTALPASDNSANYYYCMTADDGTNQVDYELGALTADAYGVRAFNVNLPLGTYTTLTVKAYKESTYTNLVWQGDCDSSVTLTDSNPFVDDLDFILKPVATAAGTGSINLRINVDPSTGITNIGIAEIEGNGGIVKSESISSSYTLTQNDVPAGTHKLLFSFFMMGGSSSVLVYQCQEIINVYDSLETDTWIKNGTSEYLKDDGSGNIEFRVTQDCVERFALSNIYVDSEVDINGTGSYFSPHNTITAAIDHAMNASFPSDPEAVIKIHIKDGHNEVLDALNGRTFSFTDNHRYEIESYSNVPGDREGTAFLILAKAGIPLFEVQTELSLYGIYLKISVQSFSPVVSIEAGGVLNMHDSHINQNPTSDGIKLTGSSTTSKAVLNMYGASSIFNCCTSSSSNTGIFGINATAYSDVYMYGSSSVYNCGTNTGSANNNCAGVYVGSNSTLTMNDSSDINGNGNSNSGTAGGVVVAYQGKLNVNGGRIYNNEIKPDVKINSGGSLKLTGTADKPIYLGYLNDCTVTLAGTFTQLTENGLTFPIFRMDSTNTTIRKLSGTDTVISENYTKFAVKNIEYSFSSTGFIVKTPPAPQDFPAGENPVFPEIGRFKVESKENLEAIRKWCNTDGESFENIAFVLDSPIDLEDAEWEPIGTSSNPFNGTFDGGGNKIEGIILANQQGTGFFGSIENATIKNVTVHCVGASLGFERIGGLVGEVSGSSLIDNCSSEGSIMAISPAIGGIVGTVVDGNSVIRNCINNTTIVTSGGSRVGGIVGDSLVNTETLEIENCANLAGITFGSNSWSSAGIIGFINSKDDDSVRIKNCINTGRIVLSSGNAKYADIVGGVEGGKKPVVQNCYYSQTDSLLGFGISKTNCTIENQEAQFSYDSITEKYKFRFTNNTSNRYDKNDVIEALNAWVNAQTTSSNYRHWENEGALIKFYD